ncbi:unnamed protein product [Diamesa tonsa]
MSTQNIQILFQNPLEPIFFPKDNGTTIIELPVAYLEDRFKAIATMPRFSDAAMKTIQVQQIPIPDISFAYEIGKKKGFSLFQQKHGDIAGKLIKILMDQPSLEDLFSVAAFCRERVNPQLFQYCLAVAIQHRPDTKSMSAPMMIQQFPDQFMSSESLNDVANEAKLPSSLRKSVEITTKKTGADIDPEHRLAYFREDILINLHHWHWHGVYPGRGDERIVSKDRRGELFYYMHNQVINRYNVERFCNNLPRVKPMENFNEIIPEGYFSKLTRSINNTAYPSRSANTQLRDINRSDIMVSVAEMDRWRNRILEAIDAGFIYNTNREQIVLTEENGIDILVNLVEASALSLNTKLYGSLHNEGHNLLAFIHDPDGHYLEDFGVMGDVATAMRDPVFYRWHGYLDTIWQRYKATLPEYTDTQLGYSDITVNSAFVKIMRNENDEKKTTPNLLLTYWKVSKLSLGTNLDLKEGEDGSNTSLSFKHLQHAPYVYKIKVTNSSAELRKGTCRIFIAPKNDEKGTILSFEQQRLMMIEMDKFTVNLKPGENILEQRADQSSVTIPYQKQFGTENLARAPEDDRAYDDFKSCNCGWPDHMILPKGSTAGMSFDLFVMISNYDDDKVVDSEGGECGDAHSFCGLRDQMFPDKRKMGFPFDRIYSTSTLKDFADAYSNMCKTPFVIRFHDEIIN